MNLYWWIQMLKLNFRRQYLRIMRRSKILAFLTFIVLTLPVNIGATQEASIDRGVQWLRSIQNPSGSWGDEVTTPTTLFRDTCVVANTLHYLSFIDTTYTKVIEWINSTPVVNTDYLARKIGSLVKSGKDITDLLNLLVSYQQGDGGWGLHRVEEGTITIYRSEPLETALVLRAFCACNYSDITKIEKAINFLIDNQNLDGGWSFTKDDESSAYLTALVLLTLTQYRQEYYLEEVISKATDWLISKQNPDGSFGVSSYETALAYSALIRCQMTDSRWQILAKTLEYIRDAQLENGSWENDPYTTALCLRAIKDSAPDLCVFSEDISFEPAVPRDGETVTITAIIYNLGGRACQNAEVLINDQLSVIDEISVGGSATVKYTETFTSGTRKIIVQVDPDNKIEERDETNNIAEKNLTVVNLPDLSLSSGDTDLRAIYSLYEVKYNLRL
jgi:prenyltransferase beta subunit